MANYEAGDYVKFEFTDKVTGQSERLWMLVDRCDDTKRLVFGRLDNQPVAFADKLKLGQELAVSFANIRDHKKPSEF